MNLVRCCSSVVGFAQESRATAPVPEGHSPLPAATLWNQRPAQLSTAPYRRAASAATANPGVARNTRGHGDPTPNGSLAPARLLIVRRVMQFRVGHSVCTPYARRNDRFSSKKRAFRSVQGKTSRPLARRPRCISFPNINTAQQGAQSLAAPLRARPIRGRSTFWRSPRVSWRTASPATRLRHVVAPNDCLFADRAPRQRPLVVGRGDDASCLRPAP